MTTSKIPLMSGLPRAMPAGQPKLPRAAALRFGAAPVSGSRIPRPDYVYHFTSAQAWKKIQATGGLKPRMYKEPGNFVLSWENLTRDWTRQTRFFGSCLQAWIGNMRANLSKLPPGEDNDIVLLKIKVAPTDQLWARDVGPIFNALNLSRWHDSVAPLSEFELKPNAIPELIIADPQTGMIPLSRIEVFRTIPLDVVSPDIWKKKIDPQVVLDHILNPDKGTMPVAPDAEPIHFNRLILRGIVTNLKNALWHYYQAAKSRGGSGSARG